MSGSSAKAAASVIISDNIVYSGRASTKRQHYLKARANAIDAAVVGNLNAGGSLTLEGSRVTKA
jgi:hypothetical protein